MKCDDCKGMRKDDRGRNLLIYIVCAVVFYRFIWISQQEWLAYVFWGIEKEILRTDNNAVISLFFGVIGISGVRAVETHIRAKSEIERERNTRSFENK